MQGRGRITERGFILTRSITTNKTRKRMKKVKEIFYGDY
ncbi:hypothetical protein WG66_008166 [Moniliophthora roreri]|nr:hypothetical protein WG66_008166 [Moniliophthora roreri]